MTKALIYMLINLGAAYQHGNAPYVIQEGIPWIFKGAPIECTIELGDVDLYVGTSIQDTIESRVFSVDFKIKY